MARIDVVEDDLALGALVRTTLEAHGWDVTCFPSAAEAFAAAGTRPPDLVVTDLELPGMRGVELCEKFAQSLPQVPVVVMTAHGSMDAAVAAMRAGAADFLPKPLDLRHLVLTVERALERRALRDEVRRLREAVKGPAALSGLVGESPAMVRLRDLVARLAKTEGTVLITGESGTGKELVARALHEQSPRRDGPFIAVNCAALPEALLESELFGHLRGAFTGARESRPGLFVEAQGGTLFLDEVAEMPLPLQPKLLRALQERRVRPLGATAEVPVDVRVVAATNRDPAAEVEKGRLRADLLYRLDVLAIGVPPLRARGNDVLLLAQHFLERRAATEGRKVTGILSATARALLAYDWPGNVRELENVIERAATLTDFDRLAPEDLPPHVRQQGSTQAVPASNDGPLLTLEEVERRHIRHVMDAVGGNKSVAARVLGVDRATLYRKLAQMASDAGERAPARARGD